MPKNYVLVKNGIVDNVIFADDDFISMIASTYDEIHAVEDLTLQFSPGDEFVSNAQALETQRRTDSAIWDAAYSIRDGIYNLWRALQS